MKNIRVYYPLDKEEYDPFFEPLEDFLFGQTKWNASGVDLTAEPRIRDHSIDMSDYLTPLFISSLKLILPENGWYEVVEL